MRDDSKHAGIDENLGSLASFVASAMTINVPLWHSAKEFVRLVNLSHRRRDLLRINPARLESEAG
ncbi:hypothetical protein ACVI1J_008982 [Bradyrhizobium diazoefficiens]